MRPRLPEPMLARCGPLPGGRIHASVRTGLLLEYATLTWNAVGSALVLVAAAQAGSVALTGFGLDSVIEIGASSLVVWQLRGEASIRRERTAVRLIGLAFLLLAVVIVAQAAYALMTSAAPDESWLGVAWLAATVAVMLTLALAKLHVGRTIHNHVLTTEARVTLIDAYLAAAVLAGLLLNATLGWWWADPLAALAIVGYAIREARLALWGRSASGANSLLAQPSQNGYRSPTPSDQ